MIARILLLPHPEHRERLLAPGAPCATRTSGDTRWSVGPRYYNDGPDGWPAFDFAVVLARDGAVCPEGVDRLARVMCWRPGDVEMCVSVLLSGRKCSRWVDPPGTLVLLDADGRQVAP